MSSQDAVKVLLGEFKKKLDEITLAESNEDAQTRLNEYWTEVDSITADLVTDLDQIHNDAEIEEDEDDDDNNDGDEDEESAKDV